MSTPAASRHAATLVVVRDATGGLEVLLLQRAEKGDYNSGAWVFPGGLLDPADRRCHAFCSGLEDTAANERLGVAQGGLDYYVAAIRECFEEAGLLFAVDESGRTVQLQGDTGARLAALRGPLHAGQCELAELCRDFGLRLAADRLFYIAHWLTPPGRAKRFDTRFFLALLPEGQTSAHDATETLDQVWLRPAEALAPENSRRLLKVTRSAIETVGRFADTDALLAWARAPREVKLVMQRMAMDSAGPRLVMPHEPAWAEIGRLDPDGQGTVWCEMRPGVAVRLSPRILRVASDADGGCNSYLIGDERGEWAVIDPGPADENHIQALIAAAPGRIHWILLTQAGSSSGATMLAERTGAQVRDPGADAGETIKLSSGTCFRATRDPQESLQRVCYLLIEEKTLFTGSMAPGGAALSPLLHEGLAWVAPGQGFLLPCADL